MPARGRKFRNPFRGVVDGVSEMNRMADRMTGADGGSTEQQPRGYANAWSPATDIVARGSDLLIRCELPGVSLDDVEVSMSRGTLTIAGERQRDEEDTEVYVRERAHGQFRRDITLPEGVKKEHIEAELTEGVLRVTVAGSAAAPGSSRIDVRAGRDRGRTG
ncbi:Hsp20/alpha crystallin family protein [Amycolatopsis cihanbeyliensis]|uniref:Heat shock protein Hsp20 n=1 Tax=Amycolatopsis cihanbeyliensis TaxID=1128664 RepID=A0A542CS94_AMYCI|nr:Hsp20/alpha crystallin family protein [Amycolatopsis cihanbeyliensis]TQI93698.1 heat shock protein Hsp20 [Amycolatopsis cihanbeyliensis]